MVSIDIVLLLIIMFVVLVPTIIVIAYVFNKRSYRNIAHIARQTGKDPNDVIWIQDKFKVRYLDGTWEIKFYKMKENTPSVQGNLWSKFLAPTQQSNKILQFKKETWDSIDMRRHLKRGVFFYETTEGEFYPMNIVADDKIFNFSTINQDNRSFVARETQNINSLTRNKNKEKLLLWAIIIGIIGLVVVGGILIYFQNKTHEENIQATAQLCGQYTIQIINALTNPTTNNTQKPQFINDIKPIISVPGG